MASEAGRVRCAGRLGSLGRKFRFKAPNGGEFMPVPLHASHAVPSCRIVPGGGCCGHDGMCPRGHAS